MIKQNKSSRSGAKSLFKWVRKGGKKQKNKTKKQVHNTLKIQISQTALIKIDTETKLFSFLNLKQVLGDGLF